jgi:hypothetical protein
MRKQLRSMGVIACGTDNFPEVHRCICGLQHFFVFLRRAAKRLGKCPCSVIRLGGKTPLPKRCVFGARFVSHAWTLGASCAP